MPFCENKKRLIHIYTGDGKGKTTAALGLVMRACGQGWRVLMVQFMKGRDDCGELKLCKSIPNFELVRYGLSTPVRRGAPKAKDIGMAHEALEKARDAVHSGRYDLIILDELNISVDYGLISLGDAEELLKDKPDSVELVLTGRNAHPALINLADYVSEIREVKHPFKKKVKARPGVDY